MKLNLQTYYPLEEVAVNKHINIIIIIDMLSYRSSQLTDAVMVFSSYTNNNYLEPFNIILYFETFKYSLFYIVKNLYCFMSDVLVLSKIGFWLSFLLKRRNGRESE